MTSDFTTLPLTGLRKIIAARMSEATRTIPHFRLTSEIEIDTLLLLRQQQRDQYPATPLSINDLLIKICASALMEVPEVNLQWVDNEIRQYSTADISVVVSVEGGLSTPVIRRAESKSVWEISKEVKALAARAVANTLKLSEIAGGSFSISNLGMFAVDQFDAIINPPQCAILAVGAARRRIVVAEGERTKIATVLSATLSCDHRAIDGAIGAKFLTSLKTRIEQPDALQAPGAG